ncbi:pilus assembly protein PilZ [Sporolactobacillus sp. THM7-7]|nr:pilus assembly protein PilZ [Sporolactobacillus sp. THM7-7]
MFLKVGEPLVLENRGERQKGKHYRCRIVEVRDKDLLIDYPVDVDKETERTPVLLNGTPFQATYVFKKRVYRFSVVFQRRVSGKIPMMLLAYNGQEAIREIQRRSYVRVEANLDVAIHSRDGAFSPFVTLTSDIGGGGVLIHLPSQAEVKEDAEVVVWLCLPGQAENRYLTFNGRIVHIYMDKTTKRVKAAIQFLTESDKERQPIIRFCFAKQLEDRKKKVEWEMNHPHR